jgi:hypothetical protein
VLHEPLDRAALASRVAPLEHDRQPLTGRFDPLLELQELDLEQALAVLVLHALHPLVVRVALAPGVHRRAVAVEQDGVVIVVVHDLVVAKRVDDIGEYVAAVHVPLYQPAQIFTSAASVTAR